jgi:putative Mg2+ transporter-C (MgtC) family protein
VTLLGIHLFSRTTATELVLLLLSFVLSAVIGMERQRRLKSAGLRTHTLVGIGATVFTLVSAYGFSAVVGQDVVLDPSRIAAQIVSGIGFLGAGVIFVRRSTVSGLTTAASIWFTAAIGMACGAGMPVLAATGTLLYLVTVSLLSIVGRRIRAADSGELWVLTYREGKGVLRTVLAEAAHQGFEATLSDMRVVESKHGSARVEAQLRIRGAGPLRDFVEHVSTIDGVKAMTNGGSAE